MGEDDIKFGLCGIGDWVSFWDGQRYVVGEVQWIKEKIRYPYTVVIYTTAGVTDPTSICEVRYKQDSE